MIIPIYVICDSCKGKMQLVEIKSDKDKKELYVAPCPKCVDECVLEKYMEEENVD